MQQVAELGRELEDLSGKELLDRVDVLHAQQRRTELLILQAAHHHAVLNNEDTIDPQRTAFGRERAVFLGGEGTPKVAEFAAAELGGRLQLSPFAAGLLMADALDLRHRLPRLWGRVRALEVKVSYARYVAKMTRELSTTRAGYVDERVAESADGRLPWSRFAALVEAAIIASDPVASAEAEARSAKAQFAHPTASDEHGLRGFYIRADFATIARVDAAVAYFADALAALGDTRSLDERRVAAVLILANPTHAVELLRAYADWREAGGAAPVVDLAKLMPVVRVFVHMSREDSEVTRIEGVGPVSPTWVQRHLGDKCRFTVTPVIDLAAQAPVDAYEIPDRHRQAVHLMTPADVFPFATNTTRGKQIDHTVPYRPGAPPGQSRIGNYGPMSTTHHRIKTFGGWEVKQPLPGIFLWRDRYGATYLVDNSGTRRIDLAVDLFFAANALEYAA
jgi:hypothetical protein